jgi:hypothetical protein
MSSPARRMFAPGRAPSTRTLPSPAGSVRSTGTTASAPSGTGAPVEIATATPGLAGSAAGWPARDSPRTSSSASGPATTA